jgi:hypothetical protein
VKRLKAKPEIRIVPRLEELALAAALHFVYRRKTLWLMDKAAARLRRDYLRMS